MKKIVIATDGSPASMEAVAFGLELAAEHDAQALFVHVVPSVDIIPMSGFGMAGGVAHYVTEADRASLEDAAALADAHGVHSSTAILRGSEAADEIVAYADNVDADMIVVGSRGHGALTSALIGSVSRAVLSESKRPVVIVRGVAHAAVAA